MLIPAPQAPPEATGPAGDLFAPAIHLMKCSFQIKLAPSIFVSGEQCRPHHHMVLRPVHMAKGQIHHSPDNGHRVCRGLGKTHSEDAVHALGVAVTAHIVSLYAAGLAGLLLMADGTLHEFVLHQIFQRGLADQTFFRIQVSVSSHSRNTVNCSGVWNQCSPPSITVSLASCWRI